MNFKPIIKDAESLCPFMFQVHINQEKQNTKYFYGMECTADNCEYFNLVSAKEGKNGTTKLYGYCNFENETKNSSLAKKISEELKYLPIYIERD